MSAPEEFKEKKPISFGLVAWAVVIAFNLGVLYATLLSTRDKVIDNSIQAKDFTEQEVGGLRSDWERQNNILRLRDSEMLDRIKDLEKYHKNKE